MSEKLSKYLNFDELVKLNEMSKDTGITLLPNDVLHGQYRSIVGDSAPSLSPNSGLPSFMLLAQAPTVIQALQQKLNIAQVADQQKVAEWKDNQAMFNIVEWSGDVDAYGDYNESTKSSANYNAVYRDIYTFQDVLTVGDREADQMSTVRNLNWVNQKRQAIAYTILNTFNRIGFKGVVNETTGKNLHIYGLQNDPLLPAPVASPAPFNALSVVEIQQLLLETLAKINEASGNNVDTQTKYVIISSPSVILEMQKSNDFANSAAVLLKKVYPNVEFVGDNGYKDVDASGDWLQVIATEVGGQPSVINGYTELYRGHNLIQEISSWKQKISAGTAGSVIQFPYAVQTLSGVFKG